MNAFTAPPKLKWSSKPAKRPDLTLRYSGVHLAGSRETKVEHDARVAVTVSQLEAIERHQRRFQRN